MFEIYHLVVCFLSVVLDTKKGLNYNYKAQQNSSSAVKNFRQ